METFIFEKYVRYTVTIYPVAIVASVGIFLGVDETEEFSDNEMMNGKTVWMYLCFHLCILHNGQVLLIAKGLSDRKWI